MELKVVFLTDRVRVGDGHVEDKVELVVRCTILDIAMLDDADEPADLGFGAQFPSAISRTRAPSTRSPGSMWPPGRKDQDFVRWRARRS